MDRILNEGFFFALGDLLLLGSLPPIVLFTVFYGVRSAWGLTLAGRSLFYAMFSLSSLVGLSVAVLIFGGDYFGREYARLVVYGMIFFTFWRMFIALLQIQHNPEKYGFKPVEKKDKKK